MPVNLRTGLSLALLVFSVACSGAIREASTPAPSALQPAATRAIAATSAPAGSAPTQPASAPPAVSLPADTVIAFLATDKSQARYRLREQLAGVNFPSDAIGTTKSLTGTVYGKMDGTIFPESKFRVDLRTLQSDDDRRDNFVRQSVLNTRNFPFAEFVPKQVKGLAVPLPTSGDVKFQLIGDLTIRGVTKSVTWEVEGKVNGGEGTGIAKTNFNFAYFNLTQPRVPLVLSIQDDIKLEVEGIIRRQ